MFSPIFCDKTERFHATHIHVIFVYQRCNQVFPFFRRAGKKPSAIMIAGFTTSSAFRYKIGTPWVHRAKKAKNTRTFKTSLVLVYHEIYGTR